MAQGLWGYLLNSSLSLPAQKGSRQPVAHEDGHDEREVPNDGHILAT